MAVINNKYQHDDQHRRHRRKGKHGEEIPVKGETLAVFVSFSSRFTIWRQLKLQNFKQETLTQIGFAINHAKLPILCET